MKKFTGINFGGNGQNREMIPMDELLCFPASELFRVEIPGLRMEMILIVFFTGMGAAYGTAKSGVGVASMGVMRPELVMKSIVPVVMAGVLGIYGLIIAVIISTGINPKAKSYYLFDGYAHLSSGLSCGLAGLSAGMAIGIVGDAGVR